MYKKDLYEGLQKIFKQTLVTLSVETRQFKNKFHRDWDNIKTKNQVHYFERHKTRQRK